MGEVCPLGITGEPGTSPEIGRGAEFASSIIIIAWRRLLPALITMGDSESVAEDAGDV